MEVATAQQLSTSAGAITGTAPPPSQHAPQQQHAFPRPGSSQPPGSRPLPSGGASVRQPTAPAVVLMHPPARPPPTSREGFGAAHYHEPHQPLSASGSRRSSREMYAVPEPYPPRVTTEGYTAPEPHPAISAWTTREGYGVPEPYPPVATRGTKEGHAVPEPYLSAPPSRRTSRDMHAASTTPEPLPSAAATAAVAAAVLSLTAASSASGATTRRGSPTSGHGRNPSVTAGTRLHNLSDVGAKLPPISHWECAAASDWG